MILTKVRAAATVSRANLRVGEATEYVELPGVGHLVALEAGDRLVELIREPGVVKLRA